MADYRELVQALVIELARRDADAAVHIEELANATLAQLRQGLWDMEPWALIGDHYEQDPQLLMDISHWYADTYLHVIKQRLRPDMLGDPLIGEAIYANEQLLRKAVQS